jgi:hypothetical protein
MANEWRYDDGSFKSTDGPVLPKMLPKRASNGVLAVEVNVCRAWKNRQLKDK